MDDKILELLQQMNSKMDNLTDKVDNLEVKVDRLEIKVDSLETKLDSLEIKVDIIDVQQKENTQILRALESAKDVHFAKLDKIENDVAHLNGEVKNIRVNLNAVEGITAKN
jgi:outer membrane murein-binding lipoprotein Lpp